MRIFWLTISLVSILPLFFVLLFVINACKHETILNGVAMVCFEGEVLPVFRTSCGISGCHDATATGGYRFTDYAGIVAGIEPGNPDKSLIYRAVTNIWSDDMMPPSQPLPIESRMLMRIWIEQGALNSTCPDTSATDTIPEVKQRACFERDILPIFSSGCGITGCHDATTAEEELVLTNYNGIRYNEKLVPFNPLASKLYQVLVTSDPDDRMPPVPRPALSKTQTDSIYKWILYGALNEDCITLCDTTGITYTTDIAGLLQNYCTGCHSGATPSGGISLTSYPAIKALAYNGKLVGVTSRQTGFKPMPPSLVLSDCLAGMFRIWVDSGAPEN